MPVIEEQILKTLLPYLKRAKVEPFGKDLEEDLPKFTLDNLIGKTIDDIKSIKNPLPYDPKVTSPNPEYFNVLMFSDESYLLFMSVGWHDFTTVNAFLVEDNIQYSNRFFEF